MDTIGNALYLGGYGIYVWPAFATAAAVLCWMAVSTVARLRGAERSLDRLRRARAKAAAPGGEAAPAEALKGQGTDP